MRTVSTEELLAGYTATGDPAMREEVILRHLDLVSRVVRRFRSRGNELDDLVQVGCVGLIKALERYDARLGIPFGAYAFPTVVGEIRRYFRDRADLIRYPRRVRELRVRQIRATERLTQELGRLPGPSEIQAAIPDADGRALHEASQSFRAVSLTEVDTRDGGPGPSDLTGGRDDEELLRAENRTAVRQMLARLSPREQILLHLRFYEGLSQARTARRLGVSQMHVCRWEHRAIEKLRRMVDY